MPSTPDLQALAQQIQRAQDDALPLPRLTRLHPGFDLAAAYATAQLVHARRVAGGARPVGRKIGFTNPALWAEYGVRDPIWGWMYTHTLVPLAAGAGRFSLAGLAEPKIEPEIALHLASAPPPGAGPQDLLACVDLVAHGLEIVQSHCPLWQFDAPDTVADGGLHGALLLGPPQPVASFGADPARALQELTITLWRDGLRIEAGRGAHALGSPLAALAHLVAVLARQPQAAPLAAGEWITTGTVTAAYAVAPGQRWHTTVDGPALPGLEVAFRA